MALACTQEEVLHVKVVTSQVLDYSAQCQRDTILFESNSSWEAKSQCEWITVERERGEDNGTVPIYIQQNDSDEERTGSIVLNFGHEQGIEITIRQNSSDLNSFATLVNLPMTYGVGWGYDYSIDHADISGVRGQIVDEEKLKKYMGEYAVVYEPYSSTESECISEQNSSELISSISESVNGEADIKIASAKISSEFSKQIKENKNRTYFWYRESRSVRMAYMTDDYISEECMTHDFKNAVELLKRGGSIRDFVNKYGTHFIWASTLGGKFDWYFTVSQDIKEAAEKVVTTISAKLLFWNISSTSVNEKLWKEISKDFIASFKVTGGGDKGRLLNAALQETASKGVQLKDPGLITQWQNCFISSSKAKDDELTMIDFCVYPIWEILECIDENIANEVKNYTLNDYLK